MADWDIQLVRLIQLLAIFNMSDSSGCLCSLLHPCDSSGSLWYTIVWLIRFPVVSVFPPSFLFNDRSFTSSSRLWSQASLPSHRSLSTRVYNTQPMKILLFIIFLLIFSLIFFYFPPSMQVIHWTQIWRPSCCVIHAASTRQYCTPTPEDFLSAWSWKSSRRHIWTLLYREIMRISYLKRW